jgi:hypothetical protein
MSEFILIWQDPIDRRWYPVARMVRGETAYLFAYTRGARKSSRFVPFGNMTKLDAIYLSRELFPIFANRVMSEKRPEFERYASWSAMTGTSGSDPLLLMATMGGGRATDTLQVYPVPERTAEDRYETVFFVHGISHLPEATQHRVFALQSGDRLYPMMDIQNPFDFDAVALRTPDPSTLVGYLPRHLTTDLKKLASDAENKLNLTVRQVNFDAPPQYRLLCRTESRWPPGFSPCSQEDYLPIAGVDLVFLLENLPADFDEPRASRGERYFGST